MKWKKAKTPAPTEQFPVDALDGSDLADPTAIVQTATPGLADDEPGDDGSAPPPPPPMPNASIPSATASQVPVAVSNMIQPASASPATPGGMRPRAEGAAYALAEWAVTWDVADDPYVVGFTSAVSQGGDLTFWANLDPTSALPTPEPSKGRALARIAQILVALRNIAVFVPVAITWFAINKSTDAFAEYAASKAGKEVNFLQFWQSGGEDGSYLSDFWRISSVALVDAAIIALIVVATLVASALQARSNASIKWAETQVERERTAIAIRIGEALQSSRQADPESITEALALSLNSLSAAARDVSDAASRMEQATSGVSALAPRMADLSQNVEKLSVRLGQDVTRSVDALVSSVSTLGVTMGGDMQKFLSDILSGLEEINEQLGRTSLTVEFGTKQLRDDLDAMHQQLSQLVGRRS